jgi:acyl-CoA synthetase (AMP-forming)/AMP-acid ligase II
MVLEMAVGGFGDRVAVGPADGGLTFAEVADRAGRLAADLRDGGRRTGAVAVAAPTGAHTPVALFGAAAAGRSYAPLNYRLPRAALAELVRRLDPVVLVVGADLAADLRAAVGEATPVVVVDEWLADLAARPSPGYTYDDAPEAPAVVLYTSGTSAAPKAAVLRHDQLAAYLFATLEFGAAAPDEVNLLAVPPFHVAGVAGLLSASYVGRRVVGLPRFTAEGWVEAARREAATHVFLVPTMLARIVAALDATGDPAGAAPRLRHLAYGGARMPLPVLERALELFPDTDFVNAYGLTETSATVSILGPADHRGGDRRRLTSAGRPVPGVELRIAGGDGAPVPPGVPGEVWLRGEQVSGAYLEVGSKLDADGWLHTGDHGWVDEDGYLYVSGRADDMIISGGENIAPAEIEDALLRHPDVAAVAVVGIDDVEWGERAAAMVVPRATRELAADDLLAWARERLGSLKTPTALLFRDELPTGPTGKVLKREVKAEFEAAPR